MSDLKKMIRQANETAVNKLKNAQPYWVDIKPAHEVLGIDKYTPVSYTHLTLPTSDLV